MSAFWTGFEKRAEDSKKPGYWARQKGVVRATANKNIGGVLAVNNTDYMKAIAKKELAHGAVGGIGGAALGALVGALSKGKGNAATGAGAGALIGGLGAASYGGHKAREKYLANKGIKSKYLGFDHDFSPEAAEKYIK